jgi:hypothetical protein
MHKLGILGDAGSFVSFCVFWRPLTFLCTLLELRNSRARTGGNDFISYFTNSEAANASGESLAALSAQALGQQQHAVPGAFQLVGQM